MHKFSTETYESLCNDPSDHYAWKIVVPQKALSYDFLLNGVLAVAALHRATTTVDKDDVPTAALGYIDTALRYYNKAFAPFQQALNNLTPLNCEAVFAHSIIITVISIALPQKLQLTTIERNDTDKATAPTTTPGSMVENIFVIFELLQGVKRILSIAQPWLKAKLFTRRHDFLNDCTDPEKELLDTDQSIPGTRSAFTKLTTLNETLASFDPDQHRINKETISLLRRCFSRYATSGEPSAVLTWISAVGKDFVECLRCRKPFPLLILMHWGVLLGQLDGRMWWARDSGKALVTELLNVLPPGTFRWDGAQLWPKERFAL